MSEHRDSGPGQTAWPAVGVAGAADEPPIVHTIVLAFAADPVTRWTWPHAQDYVTHMPSLVRAFGARAFLHGSAYRVDAHGGAALWLPPGVTPDEEPLIAIIRDTSAASARDDCLSVIERMGTFHPEGPHWYLPLIGVDPARQGRGLGDALMRYALQRCDRDGVPAYLESSNPRNIALYRRHGFEEIGAIQVGSSPTIVPMLRQPR